MSSLVTGGLGFIGSHLAKKLQESGEEVVVVDSLSDYYNPDLKKARRKALLSRLPDSNIFIIDVSNYESISQLVNKVKPTYVYHFAAQAGVRLSVEEYQRYISSNLTGFSNVLQASIEGKVPNFLYASSSSIYGDSAQIPYSESELNLKPISFYGATKLSNEILARASAIGSHTRVRGLRFFTVYGPWGRPDMAYFRLGASALGGTSFPKFGDGDVKRDFTYVEDTITGVLELAKELASHPEGFSDVVNLGGGKPHSLNELIECFSTISRKSISILKNSQVSGDVKITNANPDYLFSLTGFTPRIPLHQGVEMFYNWLSKEIDMQTLMSWLK